MSVRFFRTTGFLFLLFFLTAWAVPVGAANDGSGGLQTWNDGPAKRAIMDFVAQSTDPANPAYLPPHHRVAVFDNDGTLLPEKPYVQIDFAVRRLRDMANASTDPNIKETEPYKTALSNDISHMEKVGGRFLLELLLTTHGNMEKDDLAPLVAEFMRSVKHPLLGKPYADLAYKPMVDLLEYLRANGFETYICTGGMTDFVRGYSFDLYGIPPQNIIGTTLRTVYTEKDGRVVLVVKPELDVYNDKKYKPVAIDRHLGVRPAITVGNVYTGGDIAMLSYGASAKPSLQLLINHDDAARELAYAEENGASLDAAKQQGWVVVSMKNDWKTVFAESKGK